MAETTLRPMQPADLPVVAEIWRLAWYDGHLGHVPEALLTVRGPDHFPAYLRAHAAGTTVAEADAGPVGLTIVEADELVQIGVSSAARGTGAAGLLLADAERRIAASHDQAWLAVVPGNTRARAFYERAGWTDSGPIHREVPGPDGPIAVPVLIYVKRLDG